MEREELLGARTRHLETLEETQAGNGAPAHTAADGTYYWDYTNGDLYINDSGAGMFGNSWQHIGGGGVAVPHTLLSTPWHTDTTTNAPVRGDVLTAQGAAPTRWNRVAHPGAAAQFLRANAVDPGWAAIVAGDLPNLGGVPNLTYGVANAGGVAATYVRTDASLAVFDVNVPTTIQCDDAAATGAAAFAARRDHTHAIVCVAPVNIGVANAEGVATSFPRSDHVHAHPAGLGANLHHNEIHVVNSTGPHAEAGLTIGHVLRASGAAAFSFAAIQAGDLPGLGGVPNLTFGVANAAGAAATYVQTDATIAIFDAVVPTTIQADDAAATGAVAFAARRDHTHGMPTVAPVNIGVANVEGTAYDFVRSDHVHAHPAGLGANLHHNEVHVVNSTGPHAEAGLTIGHVLRASGAAAFSFAAIAAGDLPAHTHAGAGQGGSLVIGTTDTDATAGSVFFAGAAGVIQQDNANLFWDNATNRLSSGTNTPERALHATAAGSPSTLLERTTTSETSLVRVAAYFRYTTTQNMVDGFGVRAIWTIQDVAGVQNDIGFVGAQRDGADNTGRMDIGVWEAGTRRDWFTITNTETVVNDIQRDHDFRVEWNSGANAFFVEGSSGDVNVGDNNPDARFHIVDDDAATAATVDVAILELSSTGTPAVDFGAGLLYRLENGGNVVQDAMRLAVVWEDEGPAPADENAEFQLWLNYDNTLRLCGVVVGPGNAASVVGNQRGIGAVDFQPTRLAAAQVASGERSTIIGGTLGTASGTFSTVCGGNANTASGHTSFAYGGLASATHDGSIVWGSAAATASWANNTWTARCHGGARFYSAAGVGTGVQLAAGAAAWAAISDRAMKENFSPVGPDILDKLATLPMWSYNLKSQSPDIRHIGPVAQDFNPIFGFTEDELRINMMDISGVALASAKELCIEVVALRERVEVLEAQLAA